MATFLLSLSMLALLQLGATQQFVVLTRNQLREEIRAGITAALASTVNQSSSLLYILRNDSCTCNSLNDNLQEVVDRLSTLQLGQQQLQLVQQQMNMSVAATSRSVHQLQQEVQLLRLPGSTPSHPAASCREIKELSPTAPSGYYWLRGTGDSSVHMYCDMSRSCERDSVQRTSMEVAAPLQPSTFMAYDTHTCVVRSLATSRDHQMCLLSITIIAVSQLITLMWMVLASHMDVIPGNTSGLLQLLFTRSSLLVVCQSVPAPTSTTQLPSPSHPMWGVTTSVTLPVKVISSTDSIPMILSGMGRAVVD